MYNNQPVSEPSIQEKITIKLMVTIGLIAMIYFLNGVLNGKAIGEPILYWLLMFGIIFNCLKLLHEWYHYLKISVPEKRTEIPDYSVDIFTTFCPGEPPEMVIKTLEAIQQISYPHQAYLCDESNNPYLKQKCAELNVHHVFRNSRTDAKAGNINYALKRSKGEICVVLDPDHVPSRDFVEMVLPYFSRADIGFVQVVQAYSNINESIVAKGAAQQTFQFYGPMMMSMNSYQTVNAIGANCTFRRKALESIGGHSSGLAEDLHTAMNLHAAGWKSVYLPAVLTRGLVPSTISAYYKQQLKWARGTFELLFTTYFRNFKSFTLRQKLHYGTLPFFYFSGFIYLLNFLIPVLSLFLGIIPFKMDMLSFAFKVLPLAGMTATIRLYVQRWVMEENERGFHIIGGLLLIGTWWIYILGLCFTIFRKKVAYNPTPKDGNEKNNWGLLLPNIIVALVSVVAIVYGLNLDWNPYSLFMAGIACLNCAFMLFMIYAGREKYIYSSGKGSIYKKLNKSLWLLRHWVYFGIRRFALLGVLIVSAGLGLKLYLEQSELDILEYAVEHDHERKFYSGLFMPEKSDGITSIDKLNFFQKEYNTHFDIVSFYIPWGDKQKCHPDNKLLEKVYKNHSIPMITWEPWLDLFDSSEVKAENNVFKNIYEGNLDGYIQDFIERIKSLKNPVYLRFAHEFDNPFYPWYVGSENSAEDFKKAWKYLHSKFYRQGARNVIWVWSPWKSKSVNLCFPGKDYVDWLSVTGLNYGNLDSSQTYLEFSDIYESFHKQEVFQSGLPVMVAELGTIDTSAASQLSWFEKSMADIGHQYPEIKSITFFNSSIDQNAPAGSNLPNIDWSILKPESAFSLYESLKINNRTENFMLTDLSDKTGNEEVKLRIPASISGVNYTKAESWFKNFHTLDLKSVRKDFQMMKELGINCIKHNGPGVYDRNIFKVAEEEKLKILYGFRVPASLDFVGPNKELVEFEREVLSTIKDYKDRSSVSGWHFSNDVYHSLASNYFGAELIIQREAYLRWLQDICLKIKSVDSLRPVTMDIMAKENIEYIGRGILREVKGLDGFGIMYMKSDVEVSDNIKLPHFISYILPASFQSVKNKESFSVFMSDWQDTRKVNSVSFDGLLDHWGRPKKAYFMVSATWSENPQYFPPKIRILKPARVLAEGNTESYHAIFKKKGDWELINEKNVPSKIEWYLVKHDGNGNPLSMKLLSDNLRLELTIPKRPEDYKLYLLVYDGSSVSSALSILNTPVY